MLYWLDLFGTFSFAVSGGFLARRFELDLLGVLVLAVSTGVGGGIIRDALLGVHPPGAFQDESYLLVCIVGAIFAVFAPRFLTRSWNWVMLADALGLAVFAGLGAAVAESKGMGVLGVAMIAALTATGGGVVRDLLVNRVPVIIRKDFYATAALLGGLLFWALRHLEVSQTLALWVTIALTLSTRLWAMFNNVKLPKVGMKD